MSFKYLGATKQNLECNTINFASQFQLYKSLVTTILLYSCKTLALLVDSDKRIQAFKTKRLRKLLHISHFQHMTNDWVQSKVNFLVGPQKPLFATVKTRKPINLDGSGMSHTTTASPQPSFRAPWMVGNAIVSRGNAGWTISKSGHPCPCQNRQYTGSCR